jgi:hypothetical protein
VSNLTSVLLLLTAAVSCSYDWDQFDPRLAGGGGTSGQGAAAASGGNGQGGASTSSVGGSGGSGASGGAPAQLVDDGLLARYFLAEAESGTAPTEAVDAAPNPLALPILQDPVMSYVTEDGHRGLHWTVAGEPGGPRLPILDTKILDLDGVSAATIETVARIEEASVSGSRLVHVGVDSSWHFSLGVASAALIDVPIHFSFGINTALGSASANFPADFTAGRMVVHAVFDSTRAVAAERMRVYVNGVALSADMGAAFPVQDDVVSLDGTQAIALGNRLINGRSIHGTLFYGAYYLVAFDDAQIAHNVSILLASDD